MEAWQGDAMKHVITIGWLCGLLFFLMGCGSAPSPSKVIWAAHPAIAEQETPSFVITIEPKKGETPYFTYFLLKITNKSDSDLFIDWNTELKKCIQPINDSAGIGTANNDSWFPSDLDRLDDIAIMSR